MVFSMSISKEAVSFVPVDSLIRQSDRFFYGAATSRKFEGDDINRSGKAMVRRVGSLIEALDLPFEMPGNATVLSHDNGNAFVKILSHGLEFFVMARNPLSEKPLEELDVKNQRLDIITGVCLYSSDSVKAIATDGEEFSFTAPNVDITKIIEDFRINPQLTVYEIESIIRLSSFIRAFRSTKESGRVIINNPKVEYYLYLLPALERGFINPSKALTWFSQVDERHQRLFNIMCKRLSKNSAVQPCVVPINPLDAIRDYVISTVESGQIPQISEAKEKLTKDSRLWADIFAVEDPGSWNQLSYLSYPQAYLDVAANSNLLVAVENPTESKIFAHAKKLSNAIPEGNNNNHDIIGFYPHEMILPVGEAAKKTMYHVAEPESKTSVARIVFQAYQRNGGMK